jgi:anaerobic selenocysteine-containing dehydrogenase
LKSRSKQIDMVPAPLRDDLQRLRARFRQGESTAQSSNGEALRLIGRRDLRSNNSWMHNSERLVRGKPRCTLLLHPADAARLGIEDHRRVRVRSRVGVIEAEVEVTDDIMPGVVSLPHGWGHTRDGTQMRVAERIAGVSVNDITDEQSVDALSGNAAFNGTPVLVEAVGA